MHLKKSFHPARRPIFLAAMLALLLSGGAVGPNYQRPSTPDVSSF